MAESGGEVVNVQVTGKADPGSTAREIGAAMAGPVPRRRPDPRPGHRHGRGQGGHVARRDPGHVRPEPRRARRDRRRPDRVRGRPAALPAGLPAGDVPRAGGAQPQRGGGQHDRGDRPELRHPGERGDRSPHWPTRERGSRWPPPRPPRRPPPGPTSGSGTPPVAAHPRAPLGRGAASPPSSCSSSSPLADATGTFNSPAGVTSWMSVSASYGIMACAVCLLMISGEVDLSSGVMTGSTGLLLGLLISEVGMGFWPALAIVLVFAVLHRADQRPARHLDQAAELHRHPGHDVRAAGRRTPGVTQAITGQVRVGGIDEAAGYTAAQWVFGSRLDSTLAVHRLRGLVAAGDRRRHLGAAAHPAGQLDLRRRRGQERRPQRRASRCAAPR